MGSGFDDKMNQLRAYVKQNTSLYRDIEEESKKLERKDIEDYIKLVQKKLKQFPEKQRKFLEYSKTIMPVVSNPIEEKEITTPLDELKKKLGDDLYKTLSIKENYPIDKIITAAFDAIKKMDSTSITPHQVILLSEFIFKMIDLKKEVASIDQKFDLPDLPVLPVTTPKVNYADYSQWKKVSWTWGARSEATKEVDRCLENYRPNMHCTNPKEYLEKFNDVYLLQQAVDKWLTTRRGTSRTNAMVALKSWVDGQVQEVLKEIKEKDVDKKKWLLNKKEKENMYRDRYKGNQEDYHVTHDETKTAIFAIIGKRKSQEDRVVVDQMPDLKCLEKEVVKTVLKNTVASLQELAKKTKAGTTLSSVVTCGDTIYTTNVGDSAAFIAIINKESGNVRVERLQKQLHSVDNKVELEKILSAGFVRKYTRGVMYIGLESSEQCIAMTRSLGDNAMGESFSHEPDIDEREVKLGENEHALIINASDGLTELFEGHKDHKDKSEKWIQSIIEEDLTRNPEELSERLVIRACDDKRSEDNISVTVTPFDPDPDAVPFYTAVFDGHALPDKHALSNKPDGAEASDLLSKEFHEKLQDEVNKCKKQPTISHKNA